MARLTLRPKRGRPRWPRYRLNPRFLECLGASGRPGWLLALTGGWPHYPSFAAKLHAGIIAASPVTVERFHRLAKALGYPANEVFLDGPPEVRA